MRPVPLEYAGGDADRPPAPGDARLQECFRCGYDLRGIADERPCPECGLLAGRSRRPTDELHDTRPRWLRRLSAGVWLMLVASVLAALWPLLSETVYPARLYGALVNRRILSEWLPHAGYVLAGILFWAGAALLASREGYAPADADDAWMRRLLPLAAAVPLLALALWHVHLAARATQGWSYYRRGWTPLQIGILALATLGCTPLPLLVFARLRGLAKRARSAQLAEHCLIVGVGTSASLLVALATVVLYENAARWGLGRNWTSRSTVSLVLAVGVMVSMFLFAMWGMYLLARFALAFAAASRHRRRTWARDDRAAPLLLEPRKNGTA